MSDRARSDVGAPASGGGTVFLTGCGRSGTTILGRLLSQHPDIAYSNDRFRLWVDPFPEADVWGFGAGHGGRPARIALDERDAGAASPAARRQFLDGLARLRGDKRVLVEKVAINNFRLPFLSALVPDAPFINILRHGVEVARSIAARAAAGRWYGKGERKWDALAVYARERGLGDFVPGCMTGFARGLLEWRLSVESAEDFRARRPDVPWLGLRYEEFMENPVATARAITGFLGLPASREMEEFAAVIVRRQSPSADEAPAPAEAVAIAGPTLERLGYGVESGVAR